MGPPPGYPSLGIPLPDESPLLDEARRSKVNEIKNPQPPEMPMTPPPDDPPAPPAGPVETVVVPRTRDLGGFEVRRVLPSIQRRMVGPFVFLDQIGPVRFEGGKGIDVRPHPHIGLATVTYLFRGSILHRDSLESVQPIHPGDVNWMTAGRGIVHSERTDREVRRQPHELYGLQLWVALPQDKEETAPGFVHHGQAELPRIEDAGLRARVIAGSAFGKTSPVATLSPLFFVDVALDAGARLELDADHEERAAYLLEVDVEIDGVSYSPPQLLVFAPGHRILVAARAPVRLALVGGAPMDGPRHIWWNFVSSRKERIEQAKQDWQRDRFGVEVPDDPEFIPLPDGA
jgi:redox-sensitive bicupin YhaK (pirin superfamily)